MYKIVTFMFLLLLLIRGKNSLKSQYFYGKAVFGIFQEALSFSVSECEISPIDTIKVNFLI